MDDVRGAFAPITAEEIDSTTLRTGAHKAGSAEVWEPICPAPMEPPSLADLPTWKEVKPSAVWVYRDAAGAPMFAVVRVNLPDGGKETPPLTYGRRRWTTARGEVWDRTGWHFKKPKGALPLYGLDRLAQHDNAYVIVTEGEKKADAAGLLFPGWVGITSQGGSNAATKSDWSALSGRHVVIWPDHDKPGGDFADDVARLLDEAAAASVRVVEVPATWPERWDVADDLPEGVTVDHLKSMIASAKPANRIALPAGFSMTGRGLYFQPPAKGEDMPAPIWVCAPFSIVGMAEDGNGHGWGLVLRWTDQGGYAHQWCLPNRMLHEPNNQVMQQLADAGLTCSVDGKRHLYRCLCAIKAERRLRSVSRGGWHDGDGGPVFILADGKAFGPGARRVILQRDTAGGGERVRAAGTLADWKREVAAYAVGDDRVAFFVCASLAAPLLELANIQSGGFHLFGGSSTGKTTAARAAASVWGKAATDGQVRTWRATANGLEGIAEEACDLPLILDEISQADAREVAEVIYMIGNEGGKQRSNRDGAARRVRTWRTMFLSTGEITVAAKMGEAGKRVTAGAEVRCAELPADAGAGLGVFQTLHGKADGAALAAHLTRATQSHFGTAGRAFLSRLAAERAEDAAGLVNAIHDVLTGFSRMVPDHAAGQVGRVADRFALAAAAGELAIEWGILPWPEGEAMRAAEACFSAWLAERGGGGAAEDSAALSQVRAFIEAHGDSRFVPIRNGASGWEFVQTEATRTINRAGWRRPSDSGGLEYLILPEAWKSEVCKGLDYKRVAGMCADGGFLKLDTAGRRQRSERIPGQGKIRVYVLNGAILADVGADDGA